MAKWKSSRDYELPDTGPHLATLVSLVEMGTHDTNYGPKEQVNLGFELSTVDSAGHPHFLRTTVNVSLGSKSKARPLFEALLGRPLSDTEEQGGLDDKALLGCICMLEVEHNTGKDGKMYANIKGAMRAMKGQQPWKTTMPQSYLSFSAFDKKVLEALPNWLQDRVTASPEFKELTAPKTANAKGEAMPQTKPEPRTAPWSEELNDELPASWGD
jgi:hypothetical protein